MADGVDIDLYADDLEQDFTVKDEFGGEGVDLYDDVIAAPADGSSRQKQLRQRLRRPSDQRIRKRMEAIIISGTIWRLIISEDDINSTWAI